MKTGKRERRASPQHGGGQTQPLSEAARALLTSSVRSSLPRRSASAQPDHGPNLPNVFERLITPQQAAELFAVTKRTIRNWRREGLIEPVVMPRGRVFYRLDDLLQLVDGGKPAGHPKSR
jgi:Helix-turn-helix domain